MSRTVTQTVAIAAALAAVLIVVAQIFLPGPNDGTLADVQTWATATAERIDTIESSTLTRLATVESRLDEIRLQTDSRLNRMVGERVVNLPEDGGTYWTTLFYRDQYNDADSRRLAGYMASEPRLAALLNMTRVNTYQPGNKLYDYRYANLIGGENGVNLPAIVIQNPKGEILYKASGRNLPDSATVLADEIATALQPSGALPGKTPVTPVVFNSDSCRPKPAPVPTPAPVPAPLPDFRPAERPPTEQGLSVIAVIMVLAGAVALGVWREWKHK